MMELYRVRVTRGLAEGYLPFFLPPFFLPFFFAFFAMMRSSEKLRSEEVAVRSQTQRASALRNDQVTIHRHDGLVRATLFGG